MERMFLLFFVVNLLFMFVDNMILFLIDERKVIMIVIKKGWTGSQL